MLLQCNLFLFRDLSTVSEFPCFIFKRGRCCTQWLLNRLLFQEYWYSFHSISVNVLFSAAWALIYSTLQMLISPLWNINHINLKVCKRHPSHNYSSTSSPFCYYYRHKRQNYNHSAGTREQVTAFTALRLLMGKYQALVQSASSVTVNKRLMKVTEEVPQESFTHLLWTRGWS